MNFKITGEFIELAKLLKAAGLCESGGQAKFLIAQGQVKVDGQIEIQKGRKIHRGQIVEISGEKIKIA